MGMRALEDILPGDFIGEYLGDVITPKVHLLTSSITF